MTASTTSLSLLLLSHLQCRHLKLLPAQIHWDKRSNDSAVLPPSYMVLGISLLTYKMRISRVWRFTPVIPATQKAEAGGL
jgi:hypothetical protein